MLKSYVIFVFYDSIVNTFILLKYFILPVFIANRTYLRPTYLPYRLLHLKNYNYLPTFTVSKKSTYID